MHDNASLLERDEEFLRGQEIRLSARKDETARQAFRGIPEILEILLLGTSATPTEVCRSERVGHRRVRRSCTATAASAAACEIHLCLGVSENGRRHDPAVL